MSEQFISITVLLFGACREAAGTESLVNQLPAPVDVAQAFAHLKQRIPQIENFERSALFAVNEEHARPDQPLKDGDTLAIFPPVSGG